MIISYHEIRKAVNHSKLRKAVSVDLIPNEVLKNENTIEALNHIYNYCFDYSVTPDI